MGAGLYIVTEDEGATVGIREGGNVKKCRPVVKEPSGGTLLFRCALPARGASRARYKCAVLPLLCLGAACTGCIRPARCGNRRRPGFASALPARGASSAVPRHALQGSFASALPARGASVLPIAASNICSALPRRCLHGVHRTLPPRARGMWSLPRRCLHGVHLIIIVRAVYAILFASALPARGASVNRVINMDCQDLCLGAACTGCITAR